MNLVWQNAAIGGHRLLLLLALADNCNDDGMCYPSVPYLAQKTRQSQRNVQYCLRYLESQGLVCGAEDESGFLRYYLNVEKLLEGGANLAPGGCKPRQKLVATCTGGVQTKAKETPSSFIEPSVEPSLEPKKNPSAFSNAGGGTEPVNFSDVNEIYRAYPRKKDKGAAFKAIDRALRRLEDGENGRKLLYDDCVLFLLTAVQEFASSPAGNRGQFTPYPATFFNRSSYLDDKNEWQKLNQEEEREVYRRLEANIGVWKP